MAEEKDYLKHQGANAVIEILKGIDRDVERGEDVLMLGFCVVMLSSTFAPVAISIRKYLNAGESLTISNFILTSF